MKSAPTVNNGPYWSSSANMTTMSTIPPSAQRGPRGPGAAKPKQKESNLLNLCTQATIQGNNISVRMLEFLTTFKSHPTGFRELAHEFLDISRILWSIEAGLIDLSRKQDSHRFPTDMEKELDKKFRALNTDFQSLGHLLFRYLEYEKNGAFGKLQKSWRMMFADKDISRMRDSLAKSREGLRMSALVFRWSLGDQKSEEAAGMGYASLAEALEHIRKGKPVVGVSALGSYEAESIPTSRPAAPSPAPSPAVSEEQKSPLSDVSHAGTPRFGDDAPPRLPAMLLLERNSTPDLGGRDDSLPRGKALPDQVSRRSSRSDKMYSPRIGVAHGGPRDHPDMHREERIGSLHRPNGGLEQMPSIHSGSLHHQDNGSLHGEATGSLHRVATNGAMHGERTSINAEPAGYHPQSHGSFHNRQSDHNEGGFSSDSAITEEDNLFDKLETDSQETAPSQVIRLKADPSTVPRWTPRNHDQGNATSMKMSLVAAVRAQKHKLIQQLLDRGASPETMPDVCIMTEAILNHDTETIRLLLLFGADPNVLDTEGVTPLLTAVDESFPDAGKMFLKYGADPNLPAGPNTESPLALAVARCNPEFVHLLLTYGGDANVTMDNGETSLIRAMTKSAPKRLAEVMLDFGADPNAKSADGKTPLHDAIQNRRVDLMQLLLDRGCDPNLPGPKHLIWPSSYHAPCLKLMLARGADPAKCPGIMELAASLNNLDSVHLLLKAGVDPNLKKDGVYTPLCTAIRDNRGDIFRFLLANGADPNVPASEYPCFKAVRLHRLHMLPPLVAAGADLNSPKGIMEHAVRANNKDTLKYLMSQGVSPNAKTEEGYTALTTAIRDGRMELVEILLDNGADPNIQGQDWPIYMAVRRPAILAKILAVVPDPRNFRGSMEMAAKANQLESIKLLLKAGVSVEDKNGGVFSPLTTAIREERKEMVKFLLDEGHADPNEPGEHLPLVKALRRCRGGDYEIIKMLLDRDADINKMYRGWNAVMQAVENGDMKVLKMLIVKGGVDIEAKDEAGRSVLDIAAGRGWEEAMKMLMQGA